MKIYNDLTKRKEEFVPLDDNVVKMYACGITTSGEAHIGHALQAMVFDIIRKFLEKKGYEVKYARNYTDVDDKIIAKAKETGKDAMEYANEMMQKIDAVLAELKIDAPTYLLKATENIDVIINFVSKLIEKGFAYATPEGDVYFNVEAFDGYGKLSGRNLEDVKTGTRVELEDNKKNALDFALWKSAKPGEIYWESPWGKGRPGWHIECSAMNYATFGEQIDIHGGGRDLLFPHHENEVAQTEALTGKPFAKYWVHNGLVKVNGQKMSKSLNNSILVRELLEKYDAEVVRFAILQTNYRNDLNITDNLFPDAEKHLTNFYQILSEVDALNTSKTTEANEEINKEFDEAMEDDFNMSLAIANLFKYFKQIKANLTANQAQAIKDANAIKQTYSLLGLFKKDPKEFLSTKQNNDVPEEVQTLAEQRWQAKKNKDFATADALRNQILELGFEIKDNKEGYDILKK